MTITRGHTTITRGHMTITKVVTMTGENFENEASHVFYLVVLVCKLGGSGWGGMEHVGGKEGEKLACRLLRKRRG